MSEEQIETTPPPVDLYEHCVKLLKGEFTTMFLFLSTLFLLILFLFLEFPGFPNFRVF